MGDSTGKSRAVDVIEGLYHLLGDRTVLLPVPLGKKYPAGWASWQNISFDDTRTSEYRAYLLEAAYRGGNIGVLLGPASTELSTIDIDKDGLIAPWLALNPGMAKTTRSRGRNGCQFWFRPLGPYPNQKSVYEIKDAAGNHCGEWRCGGGKKGAQSIIFGIHPITRAPYQILTPRTAVGIEFASIRFPDGWKLTIPEEQRPRVRPVVDLGILTDRDQKRIEAYMGRVPGAVSGRGGHTQTFKAACALIQGWGLSVDEALPFMVAYNQRCEPVWTDKELLHKLEDADKEGVARGYLRTGGDGKL
jgi:hypothetical protein